MSSMMAKKFPDLAMGLFDGQENINIPQVTRAIRSIVAQIIKTCVNENRYLTVDDVIPMTTGDERDGMFLI